MKTRTPVIKIECPYFPHLPMPCGKASRIEFSVPLLLLLAFVLLFIPEPAGAGEKAAQLRETDGKDCGRSYGDKGHVWDPETRWTYFTDIVHEFAARPDGSAVVAFRLSARRYEIPKDADPAFSKAAEVSWRDGKAVHVAYEDGKNQVKRPGGGTMDGLPKVRWIDAKQQHLSCR